MEADPDSETRDAVGALIRAARSGSEDAVVELEQLFDGRIAFGTAGLRAAVGPGPNRMNRLVVRQTTAGLMRWLGSEPTVVVGFDARYGSEAFASEVVDVVAAMGGRAELLPEPLPTPVLAFAVLARSADAGVMVTASHNPPQDNGYKLYLGDGIQLVSPDDEAIAAAIDQVVIEDPAVSLSARPDRISVLDDEVVSGHIDACLDCLTGTDRAVEVVYTAMHGVGGQHLLRAFEAAGFPAPTVVTAQFHPDPDFPTVAFPNPEEPGALDRSIELATAIGADLVIANDPDADRLALAVPDRNGQEWVALSGDEIGVLLADHLLRNGVGRDHPGGRVVSNSVVSSRLLARLAAANGVESVVTLTGFKWVARPIVERPEQRFLLGYEEAIGYCIGSSVRDKDGVSAAVVAAEMVAQLGSEGATVWDRLDVMAVDHGLHLTRPVTVRFDGPDGDEQRAAAMKRFTDGPPERLGGMRRSSWFDLARGDHFAPTTGVVAEYGDLRVIVRPSGTEPKLKAYLEVIEPVDGPDDLDRARAAARERIERVAEDVRAVMMGA